jgi:phosphoserine phosphatase
MNRRQLVSTAFSLATLSAIPLLPTGCRPARAAIVPSDPLPSWNHGEARQAIEGFVASVTTVGGGNYVEPAGRSAVFDNDGTLWAEQPANALTFFAMDRARELASDHPDWLQRPQFQAAIEQNLKALIDAGELGLAELIAATHAGMTPEAFEAIVRTWLAGARNPLFGKPFEKLVYQPMLELIDFLRANEFKITILSGGGAEFLRALGERLYGIPPERIIGSTIRTRYDVGETVPRIIRLPEIDFVDEKSGKPIAINRFLGRRPIAAFGNADTDFEMLEWSTAGSGRRFGMLVHHDDAKREVAYDRTSPIGRLDRGLDEADERGWTLVSMKNDWKNVFAT